MGEIGCKKNMSTGTNEESKLLVELTPPNASTQSPQWGPDFPLKIIVASPIPSKGVNISVSAAQEGTTNYYYTKYLNTDQPQTNLKITGTPGDVTCVVQVIVTSVTDTFNKWTGSYRYSKTDTSHPIVYTDVRPDQTFDKNGTSYHLDINNDGINDVDITYGSRGQGSFCGNLKSVWITIAPLNQNETGNNNSNQVAVVQPDTVIDNAAFVWNDTSPQSLASKTTLCSAHGSDYHKTSTYYGLWRGAVDKYIALRLHTATDIYYGWVRLDVVSSLNSFTIKDYAFNSIPNQAIVAGQH